MKVVDLAAPQGFEPRYADPESAVLPLNEGAAVVDGTRIRTVILWGRGRLVNWCTPECRPLLAVVSATTPLNNRLIHVLCAIAHRSVVLKLD